MVYQPIIGLEIHAELKTESKMFCSCKNDSLQKRPNINVCPVCLGHPGVLPVINKEAVEKVAKTGLSLGCSIAEDSKFDRKNYFYPDLPKGYQISQYDMPICENGFLIMGKKKIRIKRVHLEEDTGKLLHPENSDHSLVDFNRAGVPLMELVTEPDIFSAIEAKEFSQELQLIFRHIDVSFADMEKGQMRVEANISLKKPKDKVLGTKVEVKNLNSFRAVEKAINYEIERQTEVLEKGETVVQETRGWNEIKGKTFSQREKEEAHDYRYFPEPDLPKISFSKDYITKIKKETAELPAAKRKRFLDDYRLTKKDVDFFIRNQDLAEYFEKIVKNFKGKELNKIKLTANYLISDLQGLLSGAKISDEKFLIKAENFSEFISLIDSGTISSKIAKNVLTVMFEKGNSASEIVKKQNLTSIGDDESVLNVVKEVISENKNAVSDFKKGKGNVFEYLIGKTMAKTKGRISPDKAREIMKKELTK